MNGAKNLRPLNKDICVDLETADKQILPNKTRVQFAAVENLDHDWSQIVDEMGNQIATVGHHFNLSRSFDKEEMDRIARDGTCVACHQELPKGNLATSFLHHVAKYTGQLPDTTEKHRSLVHKIVVVGAWSQVVGVAFVLGFVVWGIRRLIKRRNKTITQKDDG